MKLDKNPASLKNTFWNFIKKADLKFPIGYLDFMKQWDGASFTSKEGEYLLLWALTDLLYLNQGYAVEEFLPGFFLIGSDGGGTAYAIEKESGKIYAVPFIGMTKEYALYISDTLEDFLKELAFNK